MTQSLSIPEFPHSPPEGYSYFIEEHKRGILSIWLLHHRRYVFHASDKNIRTIWGFYRPKTRSYFAPITSKQCGNQVDITNTTPYTSMPLKFNNALEHALFGST